MKRKYAASSSATNFDADEYPSPGTSSSRPSLPFVSQLKGVLYSTPPCSRLWVQAFASYLCLSPPTSGLPIPSHAMDVHFEVDYEGTQLCYPEMKRLSRKVLCSFLNVMVYILIRDMLICYPYFGSADAWVLRNGTYWESKVVLVCGKMLTMEQWSNGKIAWLEWSFLTEWTRILAIIQIL